MDAVYLDMQKAFDKKLLMNLRNSRRSMVPVYYLTEFNINQTVSELLPVYFRGAYSIFDSLLFTLMTCHNPS